MDEILRQVQAAESKKDIGRLQLMLSALTKSRPHSYYASWSEQEAARVAEIVTAALARLRPPPKQTKRRPRKLIEVDYSTFPQGDLLTDVTRWPRRPYCTDSFDDGLRVRTLRHALRYPHISVNPPHLRSWAVFDIDRPGAVNAWQEAGLPPPTWIAINTENGHVHMSWGLSVPVLVDALGAHNAPIRYLAAIESLMRERLGADYGYAGRVTKNPTHGRWEIWRGPCLTYGLDELAAHLPGLSKHRPRKRDQNTGLGRNVTLFDTLRRWAYSHVRRYWGNGLAGWNAWLSSCNTQGLALNCDLFGPNALDGREVWHVARSVAKWTWRTFSAEGFSEWQANAGQKGGKASGRVRRAASEDKRAKARQMAADGRSQRSIAAELGVTQQAVCKWLREGDN